MSLTEISAYALVLGLFGVALVLGVVSNVMWLRVFGRLRADHASQWEALGSPRLGAKTSAFGDARVWLLSDDAVELHDEPLLRRARLARRVGWVGVFFFLLWVALWIWSVV